MSELEMESEYSEYWTKRYYVLVKDDNPVGYTIHNEETGLFAIIEYPGAGAYITKRMLESGCKVYDSMKDLPAPIARNKWKSAKEWIFFSEIAKTFQLTQKETDEVSRYVEDNATKEDIEDLIKSHVIRLRRT